MKFDKVVEKDFSSVQSLEIEKYQDLINFLKELVNCRSITPFDAGLMNKLAKELESLGFGIDLFERNNVKNLIAKRHFDDGPILAFSGHVDVVPALPETWNTDPFEASIHNGVIYGRGTTDMKGGIAAMMSATRTLINSIDKLNGTFYWLLTSDEEGEAEFGSKLIAERLEKEGVVIDACLVGEPTSNQRVGDTIRNGRRGSISGSIHILGKAGHVAYPEQTDNAAHAAGQIISRLSSVVWDNDQSNTKTSLQVTGIKTSTDLDNIVPGSCMVNFNIRYSHLYSGQKVIDRVKEVLGSFDGSLDVTWSRPCEPYYTSEGCNIRFLSLVEESIFESTGLFPLINTAGGTSDGRFFAKGSTQVVECGVRNNSIHQSNEHLPIEDLIKIEEIYLKILNKFFGAKVS